jgi:hypothetical protein
MCEVPWCWHSRHTIRSIEVSISTPLKSQWSPDSYLERLLVLQVQGIAGELGATAGPPLDQKCILAACSEYMNQPKIRT